MGAFFDKILDKHIKFTKTQKIFFVATATADSRINLSPKGLGSLKILDENRVIWLNFTGSGNETAAHMQEDSRMTIMFTSFEDTPLILRFYGQAKSVHPDEDNWAELYQHFPDDIGARQIFDLTVDKVQTSCGFGTPLFDYVGERSLLPEWSARKDEQGIKNYWQEKNSLSLDGKKIKIPKL